MPIEMKLLNCLRLKQQEGNVFLKSSYLLWHIISYGTFEEILNPGLATHLCLVIHVVTDIFIFYPPNYLHHQNTIFRHSCDENSKCNSEFFSLCVPVYVNTIQKEIPARLIFALISASYMSYFTTWRWTHYFTDQVYEFMQRIEYKKWIDWMGLFWNALYLAI